MPTSPSPWRFIPTLYFAEGVPYVLVNTVSVVLYKRLGIDNPNIAFWTSLLYLPWVAKMLWGPLVDARSTKRAWILATQFGLAVSLGVVAAALQAPWVFALTLAAFTAAAFVSATHDIAADGFYLHALDARQQALFVGIRSLFYRVAMIFGSGLLVTVAGQFEIRFDDVPRAWAVALGGTAVLYGGIWFYHRYALPRPDSDRPGRVAATGGASWRQAFATWLRQQRAAVVMAFILLYRLGEALLVKLAAPFLLDDRADGGLGFTTTELGLAYGTVGLGCLVAGGILGGWLVARFGLRRTLWPLALSLNVPNLAYLYLAHARPAPLVATVLVALEQLGYGLGFTVFLVYLMRVSRGAHRTSHYAIATGLMALGMMLPGMASGAIQAAVGYPTFFLLVVIAGLPGLALLPFLPHVDEESA